MKLDLHAKNPIKLREIIVAACVALSMFVVGCFLDFKFTNTVYHPGNESWVGIIGAAIVELPVCIGIGFGGASLIFNAPKNCKKVWTIISYIFGGLAIVVSYYFIYDTFNDISKDILRLVDYEKIIKYLAIAFAFIMEGLIVGLAALCKFKWGFDGHDMFVLGIFMIIIAATSAIASNFGKYLWSRPRPRYIYTFSDPENRFHPVWVLDPLASLIGKFKGTLAHSDDLKSFPSGHTLYAATSMFVFPYIAACSPKLREDRRILVILFYIGLAWTVIAGISRVYAGAHFLSDTAAGMMCTLLVGSLIHFLFVFKNKKAPEQGA